MTDVCRTCRSSAFRLRRLSRLSSKAACVQEAASPPKESERQRRQSPWSWTAPANDEEAATQAAVVVSDALDVKKNPKDSKNGKKMSECFKEGSKGKGKGKRKGKKGQAKAGAQAKAKGQAKVNVRKLPARESRPRVRSSKAPRDQVRRRQALRRQRRPSA